MSLLEKSKKHIQAYLLGLEKASRPIKAINLTYDLALKQVLETWKELYENPYSENIDVEKYNEACKVIELSVNDISKMREVVIYYRKNSDEAEEFGYKLNQLFDYLPMFEMNLYIGTIALPYYRMSIYQDRRGKSYRSWLKEFNDNVNVCPEPDDVYSALLAIDDTELAVKILSESGYSASEQSELISTFMDSNKKDEFCSLLSRNPIGLRSFSGLCFITESFNALSGLLDKPVNSLQGSIKFAKALQKLVTVCIDALDHDTYVEAKKEISFIDSMNQMLQSFFENNTFDISKFSSFHDRFAELGYDAYKELLNTIEESTPAERVIFERVLNRPEGQPYIQYLKRKFAEEELEPEEQDEIAEDVEKSPVSEEASSKAAFTPTLDYSDPAFITFEEFAGLDVLEDGNKYYIDSKAFPIDESKVRWSYETTTRLYEFLASYQILEDTKGKMQQKTTLIEHTPDNYYSFLVRMTGRINHNRELKTINLLAQKPEKLAYFIGRAVYKRKDATGISHEDVEARTKKARYENGIWKKSFEKFFHTDGKIDYKRVSECATLAEKTRDPYELKCNELCIQLFGELK